MRATEHSRGTVLHRLRPVAGGLAYCIGVLLSAVWITSALASLSRPWFDLAKARVGDAIVAFAGTLDLSLPGTLQLALILIGLKLLLGTSLLIAVIVAVYQRVRWGRSGDDLLELCLLLSAVASIVAAAPLAVAGEGLRALIGELMLCVIASGLASFARSAQHAAPPLAGAPLVPSSREGETVLLLQ